MARSVSIFITTYLMLLSIVDIITAVDRSFIDPNNETGVALEWIPGRSKRSLYETMPSHLRIRVNYTNGKEILVNLLKKSNYVANQHLPVRSVTGSRYELVMESVGEFVLYHDLETFSSAVYFQNSHTFIGHIGVSHVIDELPYQFDINGNYPGVVGAPYIMSRPEVLVAIHTSHIRPQLTPSEIRQDFIHSLTRHMSKNDKHSENTEPGPSSKRQKTDENLTESRIERVPNPNAITENKIRKCRRNPLSQKYYLETLVFITSDVAGMFERFYTKNGYKKWIVKYCIRYFNAVDSVFEKRQQFYIGLRINIAEIIILDNTELLDVIESGGIRFSETVGKLRGHLHQRSFRYTPDSFDHVFMITTHQIFHKSIHVSGMTDFNTNLYQMRDEGQFYNAVPITLVEFGMNYVYGVHEISRSFNIEVGPSVEEMERSGQCDNLMQEGCSMCNRCLTWNEKSVLQFRDYFRGNNNRCFLMNEPRSLRPFGPSPFLTPQRQCQCFGYDQHSGKLHGHGERISKNECSLALQCVKEVDGKSVVGYILPPFEGTRCATNKVCWKGQCVEFRRSQGSSPVTVL